MKKRGVFKGKKGIENEMIGWWIIAIAVLVIMITGYIILKEKGSDAIDFIKNLFKFGNP